MMELRRVCDVLCAVCAFELIWKIQKVFLISHLFVFFFFVLLLSLCAAACAVVVSEMAEALRTHRAEKYRKLTPDESVSALEWACGKVKTEYGLQMRNNK